MQFSLLLSASLLAALSYAQAPAAISISPGPAPAGANGGNQGAAAASSPVAGQPAPAASSAAPVMGGGVIGQGGEIPVWVIKVSDAQNKLVFSPNTVTAKAGEMVQFQFYSKNHSVASSTFEQPCVPMMQANPQATTNSFWSGFMPTDREGQLTYTIPVKDTNPIWFYCSQGMHCQGGMVGVINPPASGQTLADYTSRAAAAPMNVSPGGGIAATPNQPGQIGGTAPGTETAPPAAGTTRANGASGTAARVSWSLGVVAMVAWLLL